MPVTARKAAGVGWKQRRFLVADGNAIRATRRKAAACGDIGQVWRQAFDRLQLAAARPVEPRHGPQQAQGVGMTRAMKYRIGWALLGNTRSVHNDDPVGVAGD